MRITLLKRLREYRGEKERWYIGEVWCKFWRQNQLGVSLHCSKLRILWSVHFTMYSATVFALFKLYLHYICTEYFCTEYVCSSNRAKQPLRHKLGWSCSKLVIVRSRRDEPNFSSLLPDLQSRGREKISKKWDILLQSTGKEERKYPKNYFFYFRISLYLKCCI